MPKSWRKIAVALGLAVSPVALSAQAQQSPAPAPAEAPATATATVDADPALWVLRDDDTTIYLFGTIHVLKPGLSWFDEGVRKAFDDSDEVVLEMVTPEPQAMQALIQRLAITNGGPTLPERLAPDKRAAYLAALGEMGLPANVFDRTDPWFASTNLSILPLIKLGYDPAQGAEAQITAAAKSARKPVSGLETAEQQLGYFESLPDTAQIKLLNSTVAELPRIQPMIETMVDAWAKGQPDRLATVMNDGLTDVPEVAQVLLADRNTRWAEWIDTRLDKPGTVFMAVGAGHLAGHDSVMAKLADRKLRAVRVPY
ncbi:TraB/GumN family protein [Sphingomonas sp.]|uniref:TraB/GumN family protein n=1 Tax=Sphingomonas sp. TaxID=28214 RepID=UPI002C9D6B9D|nr:TraB/GumN family protein [Sphingomonas sp.]HTG38670.1 TraB/GumN family protein [Sphingomonas sp.]